jgi:hypothetical protein
VNRAPRITATCSQTPQFCDAPDHQPYYNDLIDGKTALFADINQSGRIYEEFNKETTCPVTFRISNLHVEVRLYLRRYESHRSMKY